MPDSAKNILKTRVHDADVLAFVEQFAQTDQKRQDSLDLIALMEKVSGCPAKMWGASMIGFGSYHYKSEKSRQEGDWFLVGFSPRKVAISLYVYTGEPEHAPLLEGLGKFKAAKACLYIQKLADIDTAVLTKIMKATIAFLQKKYKA
jgi:hypothetical protein